MFGANWLERNTDLRHGALKAGGGACSLTSPRAAVTSEELYAYKESVAMVTESVGITQGNYVI